MAEQVVGEDAEHRVGGFLALDTVDAGVMDC